MKRSVSLSALPIACALLVAACGGARPPVAATTAATTTPATDPTPVETKPAEPVQDARFPGGPGVTLVIDQLWDANKDPIIASTKNTFDARVTRARERLAETGVTTDEGVAFRAVSPKNMAGPFGCYELVVRLKGYTTMRRADHKLCGLPYAADPSQLYTGAGPRFTIARLTKELAAIGVMTPNDARTAGKKALGLPDVMDGDDIGWSAIGGRTDEAPISCHVLRISTTTTLKAAPLSTCGVTWPPPRERFEAGPPIPPTPLAPAYEACGKCSDKSICVIDKTTPKAASLMASSPDELKAEYGDGRPAPVTVTQRCIPIPKTCNTLAASCFFGAPMPGKPPDPGPCRTQSSTRGWGFVQAPPKPASQGSTMNRPYLTCSFVDNG